MAKFNAKNTTESVRNLAIERARYKLEAFGASRPEQIVDFNFAERNCYGRIDYNRNAVIPKPEYLKTVLFYTSDQNTSLMMDFVANAFNDMRDRMIKACRLGIISRQHPFLSQVEVNRAYASPTAMYREYMKFVISKYNNEYLPSLEPKTVVLNFNDYWKNMLNFCEFMGPQFPITFTGFQRSKHSSIFCTGLVIDIAGLPIDDDGPKADRFIDTTEWEYYSNVAKYHGFSISLNAPWILVADLQSPAMIEYMNGVSLKNSYEMFAKRFQRATNFELELLKIVMIEGYNNYALGYSYHKKNYVCDDGSLKHKIIERETTNIGTVNASINGIAFHVLYAQVRNIEEGKPLRKPDLIRAIAKMKYFYSNLSPEQSMSYINEQYRSLYRFKIGTTHHYMERSKLLKEIEEKEATTEERVTAMQSPDFLPISIPDPKIGNY